MASVATAAVAVAVSRGVTGLLPARPSPHAAGRTTQSQSQRRAAAGAFGAPKRFARATSMGMSSPSDVGAGRPSVGAEEPSVPPLFDASEYAEDGIDAVAAVAAPDVIFEDVESDYDALLPSPSAENDDKEMMDFESNALSDDEDRILTDREDRLFQYINNTQKVESCILVGVEDLSAARKAKKMGRQNGDVDISLTWTLEESMAEMRELIKTSGLSLKGEVTQRLQEVNPRTYIGTGKVKEAQALLEEINGELERGGEGHCCTVVFDAELYPGQQKALENAFNKKVRDSFCVARRTQEGGRESCKRIILTNSRDRNGRSSRTTSWAATRTTW